jgi:hypothetical protein
MSHLKVGLALIAGCVFGALVAAWYKPAVVEQLPLEQLAGCASASKAWGAFKGSGEMFQVAPGGPTIKGNTLYFEDAAGTIRFLPLQNGCLVVTRD